MTVEEMREPMTIDEKWDRLSAQPAEAIAYMAEANREIAEMLGPDYEPAQFKNVDEAWEYLNSFPLPETDQLDTFECDAACDRQQQMQLRLDDLEARVVRLEAKLS